MSTAVLRGWSARGGRQSQCVHQQRRKKSLTTKFLGAVCALTHGKLLTTSSAVHHDEDWMTIPTVDVGALMRDADDTPAAQTAAKALSEAFARTGFAVITNHGVDGDVIRALRTEALAFFASDDKFAYDRGLGYGHGGYVRFAESGCFRTSVPRTQTCDDRVCRTGHHHILRCAVAGRLLETRRPRRVADAVGADVDGRRVRLLPRGRRRRAARAQDARVAVSPPVAPAEPRHAARARARLGRAARRDSRRRRRDGRRLGRAARVLPRPGRRRGPSRGGPDALRRARRLVDLHRAQSRPRSTAGPPSLPRRPRRRSLGRRRRRLEDRRHESTERDGHRQGQRALGRRALRARLVRHQHRRLALQVDAPRLEGEHSPRPARAGRAPLCRHVGPRRPAGRAALRGLLDPRRRRRRSYSCRAVVARRRLDARLPRRARQAPPTGVRRRARPPHGCRDPGRRRQDPRAPQVSGCMFIGSHTALAPTRLRHFPVFASLTPVSSSRISYPSPRRLRLSAFCVGGRVGGAEVPAVRC
mmetsp:Transcript_2441/g.9340  ORF Transcript_2441/g.9340 Transcript_2441/m.9340 type:complete len:530 (-) Transcript_2441:107-1696(-)